MAHKARCDSATQKKDLAERRYFHPTQVTLRKRINHKTYEVQLSGSTPLQGMLAKLKQRNCKNQILREPVPQFNQINGQVY